MLQSSPAFASRAKHRLAFHVQILPGALGTRSKQKAVIGAALPNQFEFLQLRTADAPTLVNAFLFPPGRSLYTFDDTGARSDSPAHANPSFSLRAAGMILAGVTQLIVP
jgi:hypothetical protein